jgi:plastocyanin
MRRVLAAAVAAVLVIALAAPALASAPASKTKAKVGNFYFHPGKLTVKRGTKVTWRFVSGLHNVVVKKGPAKFNSGFRRAPTSFSFVFKKAGVYHLVCTIHPGMHETVIVK